MNKDRFSTNYNKLSRRRRATRLLGLATAAGLLVSACTTEGEPVALPASTAPTTTVEAPSTTTTAPEPTEFELQEMRRADAEAYILSGERNTEINQTVQEAGSRILEAAESGSLGSFNFFNFETGEWGRGTGNEGWGALQHNPQYGGSEHQIAVDVYQNADGSINTSKGIHGITIFIDGKPGVKFGSPVNAELMLESEPTEQFAWSATVINWTSDKSSLTSQASMFETYDTTAEDLESVDRQALDLLSDHMQELGLTTQQ